MTTKYGVMDAATMKKIWPATGSRRKMQKRKYKSVCMRATTRTCRRACPRWIFV